MSTVFVFNAINHQFPSAVFSSKELAVAWIDRHGLSGTVTEMPVDVSAYDHAIQNNLFTPKKPKEFEPDFMARFSSRLWHDHFGPEFHQG